MNRLSQSAFSPSLRLLQHHRLVIGPLRRRRIGLLVVAIAALCVSGVPAGAQPPGPAGPAVIWAGQIARQDVPALPGSEPDTLVEPDVAVSPINSNVAVAVAHDGRYPDGGAVGIETAWTNDGGAIWHHQPLVGVTSATGGGAVWARASDPVVAFDADGSAYVSVLVFDLGCDSGVVVSRSTNGGKTFGSPVFAHRSSTCTVSDDKNTLVVDTSAKSPHRGRIYQFWTRYLTDKLGHADGSPQGLVYSDDHARTWSRVVNVTLPHANTQNSQPMLLPTGNLVDAYTDSGPNPADEGSEAAGVRAAHRHVTSPAPVAAASPFQPVLTTVVSTDGGNTWRPGGDITRDLGGGPPGFRCCLVSATADPVTGHLYAVWNAVDPTKVRLSSSTNGKKWSVPITVNPASAAWLGVNADVAAEGGTVAVSYGVTNSNVTGGRFGRQLVSLSDNNGAHFGNPLTLGPVTNYAYAANAGGIFPGDYIGSSLRHHRLHTVWMVSGTPPEAGAKYHQVMWSATLNTSPRPAPATPSTNLLALLEH